eukprot:TRINITY_DN12491_c0_g1_i1.p1 TRINITY_DN12491_c0_g1~~TRINITY_DN12491_c0_g1_i1.p1  ORF type:complete len:489 (+),score=101.62 TRINITY_DN12491_c0_g1_i1:82-1548(+)
MTWETPRVASARRYKAPSRSASSPAFQRSASVYGQPRERGNAREIKHRLGRPPPDPYGVADSSEPEFTAREERARQKCSHLRQDIARRRTEEQQLAQRLESIEDSLQLRTQRLEELVGQLPQARGAGNFKSADLMERLAQLHAWANDQKDTTEIEQHGRLWEKHAEGSSDPEERKNHLRMDISSTSSDTHAVDMYDRCHPRSASEGPGRGQIPGRHGDSGLAEYAQSQKELHAKLEEISQQLEEERRARQAQDSVSNRLVDLAAGQELSRAEPSTCSGAGRLPPAPECEGVSSFVSEGPRCKEPSGPLPASTTIGQAGQPAGPHTLRQELEALREGERAQRAAVRRRCRAAAAAAAGAAAEVAALASDDPQLVVQEARALDKSASNADLREELRQLQQHCHEVEQRAIEAETAAGEAQRAESAAVELARAAEQRAWAATEAANELAFQADLRQVEALEEQLRLQRLLREAEARCELLESVANQMALQK